MKLSKRTLEILKNFSQINSSIMLKKGQFVNTKSVNNVIYAEANLTDVIDADMGIYDVNQFLGVMNTIGVDADITDKGEMIEIKCGKSRFVNMEACDPSTIIHPKKALNFPVADVIFDLKWAQFDELKKISSSLGLTHLVITNKNGKIVISGIGSDGNKSKYDMEITDYDGTAEFEFVLVLGNMKMIEDEYKVMVTKQGAIRFEGANGVSYIISLEAGSKYIA